MSRLPAVQRVEDRSSEGSNEYEYEYRDAEYEYEKKNAQGIAPENSVERFPLV